MSRVRRHRHSFCQWRPAPQRARRAACSFGTRFAAFFPNLSSDRRPSARAAGRVPAFSGIFFPVVSVLRIYTRRTAWPGRGFRCLATVAHAHKRPRRCPPCSALQTVRLARLGLFPGSLGCSGTRRVSPRAALSPHPAPLAPLGVPLACPPPCSLACSLALQSCLAVRLVAWLL